MEPGGGLIDSRGSQWFELPNLRAEAILQCLLCGGTTSRLFSHSGFDVFWCDQCDFGRLAGDFTPEQVSSFYGPNYYTRRSEVKAPKDTLVDRILTRAAWQFDDSKPLHPSEVAGSSICDIGCGDGANLAIFNDAGFRTVGIDPDPVAAEKARSHSEVFIGSAETTVLSDQFDVVLLSHSLEHCVDPIAAVRNAAKMLAPDGTLVVEVPNNAALGFNWFKGKWPWTDIPRHLSFFTRRSLEKIAATADLSISATYYTGFRRQFAPWWRRRTESNRSGWPLLAATAFAPPDRKYDSIRIHARRA